jgi:hypothetical protein
MDAFQCEDTKRALRAREAPVVWVEFRTAVEVSVQSHSHTAAGLARPAKVRPNANEHALVIEQTKGLAGDQFHAVTVTIQIFFHNAQYYITAVAEKWLTKGALPVSLKTQTWRFDIDPDIAEDRAWLTHEGTRVSAQEAAEKVLLPVLVFDF